MFGRIIAIENDSRHLYANRGFLIVKETSVERHEIGRIPLDDVAAVIANAHGLTYTNNLLVRLAELGIPFVLCGPNHNAVGMLLSVEGNHQQAHRMEYQASASRTLKKRLWAELVSRKLEQQAAVLCALGRPSAFLVRLATKVKSGDPENLEAQGAKHYWHALFGEAFRRDQGQTGINSLLNYGYTVLRAATARAVVAAGLHPSIGLHHSNDSNAMRLVDDLMEPFRPFVDRCIWNLAQGQVAEVTAEAKKSLVQVIYQPLPSEIGRTPIGLYLQRTAVSLVRVLLGEQDHLDLPPAVGD